MYLLGSGCLQKDMFGHVCVDGHLLHPRLNFGAGSQIIGRVNREVICFFQPGRLVWGCTGFLGAFVLTFASLFFRPTNARVREGNPGRLTDTQRVIHLKKSQ